MSTFLELAGFVALLVFGWLAAGLVGVVVLVVAIVLLLGGLWLDNG